MSDPADYQRLLGDMLRLGTVASVDLAAGTCRVTIGDLETGDLPWLTGAAGETHIWMPVSVGEQVLVFAPEGDTLAGLVLRGLPSDVNPAPGNDTRIVIKLPDGGLLAYDPEDQQLDVILPEGGKARLICDVEIDGKLKVTGEIASDQDVTADGISLKTHKHGGVQAGSAQTGAPQ